MLGHALGPLQRLAELGTRLAQALFKKNGTTVVSPPGPPLYVQRWDQGALQPIRCQTVSGYLFVLRGQRTNLQDLCDKFLNKPSGGSGPSYRALTDFVLLTFDKTARLLPENPPASNLGFTPETEASLWVLTAVMREEAGVPVVDHLAFFVPYIFVEESLAIMGGREVYGFPKEQAWLVIPTDPSTATLLTADVVGIRKFDPNGQFARLRLVDVADVGNQPANPSMLSLVDLIATVKDEVLSNLMLPDAGLIPNLLEDLLKRQLPLVFLKQLFDAADGRRACYQAIIEAPARVTRGPNIQQLQQTFQITWQQLDSHPVGRDLGLPPQQQALRAYYVDFDFVIENGTTVWQAP